jgi:FtsZ-interacting cell division protein YlmF
MSMKDKLRGFLGFLGLIEDEYGEYGSTGTAPARPFTDSSTTAEVEPEWTQAPSSARQFPTSSTSATPMRPATQPRTAPVRPSSISVLDASGQAPRIRPMPSAAPRGGSSFSPERDVAIFAPRSYDESRRITDILRSNRAVVLNVTSVDPNLGRRLVDFASGTAYALNAKIEILGNSLYLMSPQGMHLGPEAKDRLREANYRDLGDA